MLTKEDVSEILKELIVTHDNNRLKLDYSDLYPNATLVQSLGFDSLDVTELAVSIEDKLDIHIKNSEIENVLKRTDIEGLTSFVYDKYREAREQEI